VLASLAHSGCAVVQRGDAAGQPPHGQAELTVGRDGAATLGPPVASPGAGVRLAGWGSVSDCHFRKNSCRISWEAWYKAVELHRAVAVRM
jgi:hypothetical protein